MKICKSAMLGLLALVVAAVVPASAADVTIASRHTPVLDPHFQWADANISYYQQLYGALTQTDVTNTVLPSLAMSWEAVGPTEWRFHLRDDVKFHDGSPVSAHDVVASYERMRTIKAAASYTGAIVGLKSVTAIDDNTVSLTLDRPNPLVPHRVSLINIIPARLAAVEGDGFATGEAAVGFGPYKLASYRNNERIVLERNPDYFGTPAKWDRVTYRFIADPAARVAALLGEDVDMIDAVPPHLVGHLREQDNVNVITGPSNRVLFLTVDSSRDRSPFVTDLNGVPLDHNPLKDVRVRKAMSLSIDREALKLRVMHGLSYPTGQITPKGYGGYNDTIPVPQADIDRAKALLTDAGYPDGFGLSIHCTNDRYVEDARLCQALGQMLSRIGIRTKVETLPASVLVPQAMDQNGQRYSVAMLGWSDSAGEALVMVSTVHTRTEKAGAWNWGNYSNPEVDALIDQSLQNFDVLLRHRQLADAMKIAMDDVAVIPLHQQSVIVATRKGLTYETWLTENTIADSISEIAD